MHFHLVLTSYLARGTQQTSISIFFAYQILLSVNWIKKKKNEKCFKLLNIVGVHGREFGAKVA